MWGAGPGRFLARSTQWRHFEKDRFFFKMQKLLTKFSVPATSGRHNSPMITNAENGRPIGPHRGCLVFIFTVRINSKSFPWDVRCAPERDLPKFLATSVARYRPIVRCSAGVAQSHRYGSGVAKWVIYWRKADWIGNLKVSNTADNAGITQSQARDTRYRRMQELNRLCVSRH